MTENQNSMKPMRFCKACNSELQGRSDKKFCDVYCKSAFHYEQSRVDVDNLFLKIDRQLKKNRKILKTYNKAGKATVRAQALLELGFNPDFFTHYWKNKSGDVYLFVYEFGFLSRIENGKKKYVLVTWQPYMEK